MEASYSTLIDFDWSARMTLSSDKLSGLRKPTLLLKLEMQAPDGSKTDKLLELTQSELDELLTKLRAAQSVIQRV